MVNFRRSPDFKSKLGLADSRDIALKALVFLATNTGECEQFLSVSGLALEDLRQRAGDDEFLGGVLDFILGDEKLLMRFADAEGIQPEAPAAALRGLFPGGEDAES